MYQGAIKPAFNYQYYCSLRPDKKILKKSMYQLLDNPEQLMQQLTKKLAADELRYEQSCQACEKYFKIKE